MSYRANFYSDPSGDADQQYLMPNSGRSRNGHPDTFYGGDTLPLHQMSSDGHPVQVKKRIGTLGNLLKEIVFFI